MGDIRHEEHKTQIANQQGTEKSNCQGMENLTKNSPPPARNKEDETKIPINQERETQWSRNVEENPSRATVKTLASHHN